jgi:Cys-tRNA(Pro)/Cys-tRNA(Cys) deacylase
VPVAQLQFLTGYIHGGVTALACKKPYPVFVHETVRSFPVISVSAGKRGLQVLLAPEDYLRAAAATVASIARPVHLP